MINKVWCFCSGPNLERREFINGFCGNCGANILRVALWQLQISTAHDWNTNGADTATLAREYLKKLEINS